jgi:hypothetical protein
MNYRFEVSITVAGTPYIAGQTVDGAAIPPGSLDSLRRLRQVVECPDEETPAQNAGAGEAADPKTAPKTRKK